jgi:hypothetical protein
MARWYKTAQIILVASLIGLMTTLLLHMKLPPEAVDNII